MRARSKNINYVVLTLLMLITGSQAIVQWQMENPDRGVIAIHTPNDSVFISQRWQPGTGGMVGW